MNTKTNNKGIKIVHRKDLLNRKEGSNRRTKTEKKKKKKKT